MLIVFVCFWSLAGLKNLRNKRVCLQPNKNSEILRIIFSWEPDTKREQEITKNKSASANNSQDKAHILQETTDSSNLNNSVEISKESLSNTKPIASNIEELSVNSKQSPSNSSESNSNSTNYASALKEATLNVSSLSSKGSTNEISEPMEESFNDINNSTAEDKSILIDSDNSESDRKNLDSSIQVTPSKRLSLKQMEKRLDSEKKRLEKQKRKEERDREREEKEKERLRQKEEKEKLRLEKEQQKLKEKLERQKEREQKEEQKRKEKEEKEQKRKEKEEKEEQKRKEKEQEKIKRQTEIDEKNKEKQKMEEQKQKAAAAFVNFFVAKKSSELAEEKKQQEIISSIFMPFEVKNDMRLAPLQRRILSREDKETLTKLIETQDSKLSYLLDIKNGKTIGKSENTWPYEEEENNDVIIVEEETDLGQSILEEKPKACKMRAKYLLFRENQRPPYFGTWRKKSKHVKPRKPFAQDKDCFNYEVDSDDEWEEEDPGESLHGSDDEDKENDSSNEYEVDNDFFVPHGHLSEDEMDDEENAAFSPESHKFKLKILKNEFDEEMKLKTHKIKPRLIGCIWYNKDHEIEDAAIDKYLKPFTILHNNNIIIKERSNSRLNDVKNGTINLDKEHVRDFLKVIDGNTRKRKVIVEEFQKHLQEKDVVVSKQTLNKCFRRMAQWGKGEANSKKLLSWSISEEYKKEYSI